MAAASRNRYRLGTMIIVVALFAAGCGGGNKAGDTSSNSGTSSQAGGKPDASGAFGSYHPGDGSTPAPYPCDKLTANDVGTLLGGTYTYKAGPQGQCDFDPADPAASPTAYVRIEPFKKDFPTFLGANPGATKVDVALGGFFADDPQSKILKNGYAQLTKDGVTLSATLAGGKQADRDAKIKGLLLLAASKL